MNILITSASRKVSLVKEFKSALEKEGGGKVIAVDVSPLAAALYFADESYLVPPSTDPSYLSLIVDFCRKQQVNLIVPSRDEELSFFSKNRDHFEEMGAVVMVAESATIAICQDKKRFIEFCLDNGFNIPKVYTLVRELDDKDFPVFIRPRFGKGSQNSQQVNSKDDLQGILKRVPDVIIQALIQAPEYTIDLFADFSGRVISAVPRERIYVFGGESFISKTTNQPLLIKEAIRLATTLNLRGHNTIQCFLDDGVVKFIEVNPRFGGAANLSFAAGASSPSFLVKLLKGDSVEPQIGAFIDGYIMLRHTNDVFINETSLIRRTIA